MSNNILLITGGSSDLGKELIQKNLNNYHKIIAHYNKSNQELEQIQKENKDKLILLQCDFMDTKKTEEFAQEIIKQDLIPTHFVHLAAIPPQATKFSKNIWEIFDNEIKASFQSAIIICHALLPTMAKQKYGKIIFMLSSYVDKQPPIKFMIPYTSIKYALLGLLKGLSAEYANKGITINGISPSMIETKFLKEVPSLVVEMSANESPISRNLTVHDVIPTIEFLLSKDSDCITGQNIAVTAGN